MTLFLSLGFVLMCSQPMPGAKHGLLMIDHPMLLRYIPLKVKCKGDV